MFDATWRQASPNCIVSKYKYFFNTNIYKITSAISMKPQRSPVKTGAPRTEPGKMIPHPLSATE